MPKTINLAPSVHQWRNRRPTTLKEFDVLLEEFWEIIPSEKNGLDEVVTSLYKKVQKIKRQKNPQSQLDVDSYSHFCATFLKKDQGSKTLSERLKIAIEIYTKANHKLLDLDEDSEEYKTLFWVQKKFYKFIEFIANEKNISAEKIKIIYQKLKIDFSYLPNHLPNYLSEPPYLDPNNNDLGFSDEERDKYLLKLKKRNVFQAIEKLKQAIYVFRQLTEGDKKNNQYLQIVADKCKQFIAKVFNSETITDTQIDSLDQRLKAKDERLINFLAKDLNLENDPALNEKLLRIKFLEQRMSEIKAEIKKGGLLKLRDEYIKKEILPKILIEFQHMSKEKRNRLTEKEVKSLQILSDMEHELVKKYDILKVFLQRNPEATDPTDSQVDFDKERFEKNEQNAFSLLREWRRNKNTTFFLDPVRNKQVFAKHLTLYEREQYRLVLNDGKFYRIRQGRKGLFAMPFDTSKHKSHEKIGWAAIVMTPQGELFAATHNKANLLTHSVFNRGLFLRASGEIKTDSEGNVKKIGGYSGHYAPNKKQIGKFSHDLHSKGVNLNKAVICPLDIDKIELEKSKLAYLAQSKLKTPEEVAHLRNHVEVDIERGKYFKKLRFQLTSEKILQEKRQEFYHLTQRVKQCKDEEERKVLDKKITNWSSEKSSLQKDGYALLEIQPLNFKTLLAQTALITVALLGIAAIVTTILLSSGLALIPFVCLLVAGSLLTSPLLAYGTKRIHQTIREKKAIQSLRLNEEEGLIAQPSVRGITTQQLMREMPKVEVLVPDHVDLNYQDRNDSDTSNAGDDAKALSNTPSHSIIPREWEYDEENSIPVMG